MLGPLRSVLLQAITAKNRQRPRADLSDDHLDRFDHQTRAFGKDGQLDLRRLCAGFIGAGGLGSIASVGMTGCWRIHPDMVRTCA